MGSLLHANRCLCFLRNCWGSQDFIRNFTYQVHHLIKLTCKNATFEFHKPQIAAQEDLKQAVLMSPALHPIDYTSDIPVILAVDTSHIAVGFFLCQCAPDNPKTRYYNQFGSITLNNHEARFSQPKLEIYGLYRVLCNL